MAAIFCELVAQGETLQVCAAICVLAAPHIAQAHLHSFAISDILLISDIYDFLFVKHRFGFPYCRYFFFYVFLSYNSDDVSLLFFNYTIDFNHFDHCY
jgi:hypothetical protein